MPRITADSVSNFDASKETSTLTRKGQPVYWPPVHHGGLQGAEEPVEERAGLEQAYHPQQLEPPAQSARKSEWVDHAVATTDLSQEEAEAMTKAQLIEHVQGGESQSVGTSSSASEKKQDKSGSSAQETEPSLQSPALDAENPSSADREQEPAPSSTADSTSGDTRTTGSSLPDQSNSSAEALQTEADHTDGHDLIREARLAYDAGRFAEARDLLVQAKEADPSTADEVDTALEAVATAEAAHSGGYSEEDPGAGGYLVK